MSKEIVKKEKLEGYSVMLVDIKSLLEKAKLRAYKAVDNIRVQTYWQIGERISREEFKYKNVKIIRIPSIPAYFYEDFRFTSIINPSLIKLLKKEKIDIIHFQAPMPLGFQSIIISKIFKIPLIGTFHTFFADPQYLKHMNLDYKIIEKFSWVYARGYYNRCDLITAPALETKKELLENNFKEPIKVISNGIDFKQFDNRTKKEVKQKYNPNGRPSFIYRKNCS